MAGGPYGEGPLTLQTGQTIYGMNVLLLGYDEWFNPIIIQWETADAVMIVGNNAGPIFTCDGSAGFRNLFLTGNQIPGAGGGIRATGGSVLVAGCCLDELMADRGGAIAGEGTDLALADCRFLSNEALTGDGGAICLNGGSLTIPAYLSAPPPKGGPPPTGTCTFTSNRALAGSGGAIFAKGATVSISFSSFTSNEALAGGACDFTKCNVAWQEVQVCQLNKAHNGRGGAIRAEGGRLEIVHSTFTDNQALLDRGGAISVRSAELLRVSQHSAFIENRTLAPQGVTGNYPGGGGGIHLESVTLAEVIDTKFTKNHATAYGGAIASKGTSLHTLKVSGADSVFEENDVSGYPPVGGAIGVTGSETLFGIQQGAAGGMNLNVEGAKFLKNHATNTGGATPGLLFGWGGGLFLEGFTTRAKLTGCVFDGNTSTGDGGGIACMDFAHLECEGGRLLNNHADDDGGAAYTTAFGNSRFAQVQIGPMNNAVNEGGGFHVTASGHLKCEGGVAVFDNDSQTARGGGISVRNARLTMDAGSGQIEVHDNRAPVDGGGISILSEQNFPGLANLPPIFVSDGQVHVYGNAAGQRGGGVAAVKRDQKPLAFHMRGEFLIEGNHAGDSVLTTMSDGMYLGDIADASGAAETHMKGLLGEIKQVEGLLKGLQGMGVVRMAYLQDAGISVDKDRLKGGRVRSHDHGGVVIVEQTKRSLPDQNLVVTDVGVLDNQEINVALDGASPLFNHVRISRSGTAGVKAVRSDAVFTNGRFSANQHTQLELDQSSMVISRNNLFGLSSSTYGVNLSGTSSATRINYNNIIGHTSYGVFYQHNGIALLAVDAIENYWGGTGPSDPNTDGGTAEGPTFAGTGDRVGDGIRYRPFHPVVWLYP